jgi:multidrug resistance efflux pump
VQRLPVKIAIDPDQELAARLRAGMSVVVRLDTAQPEPQPAPQPEARP